MRRVFIALAVAASLPIFSAAAQPPRPTAVAHARRELRQDIRDLKRDRVDLRQHVRAGAVGQVRRDTRELKRDRREIRHDRRVIKRHVARKRGT